MHKSMNLLHVKFHNDSSDSLFKITIFMLKIGPKLVKFCNIPNLTLNVHCNNFAMKSHILTNLDFFKRKTCILLGKIYKKILYPYMLVFKFESVNYQHSHLF